MRFNRSVLLAVLLVGSFLPASPSLAAPTVRSRPHITQLHIPEVSITGSGYFAVMLADDTIAFTRHGIFRFDWSGMLASRGDIHPLPGIAVPRDAEGVRISKLGVVSVRLPKKGRQTLGTLTGATFANPAGLRSIGHGLFVESAESGPAQYGQFGNGTLGRLTVRR